MSTRYSRNDVERMAGLVRADMIEAGMIPDRANIVVHKGSSSYARPWVVQVWDGEYSGPGGTIRTVLEELEYGTTASTTYEKLQTVHLVLMATNRPRPDWS